MGDDGLRVTDGQVVIDINPDRTARTEICLSGEWETVVDGLRLDHVVIEKEGNWTVSDPAGVRVRLEAGEGLEIAGEPKSVLGGFAGISIEAIEFERTLGFYRALGFEVSQGGHEQGWVSLARDNCFGVSIMRSGMCPHLFPAPGLTYFNSGKNLENIDRIRKAGVAILEEISCFNEQGIVDNVILRDPGGTGFFVFND